MKKKIVCLLAMLLAVAMVAMGCASNSSEDSYDSYETEGSYDAGGFDASLGSYYSDATDIDEDAVASQELEASSKSVSGSKPNISNDENSGAMSSEGSTEKVSESDSEETEYATDRKIVYTSYINIETKKFDDDVEALKKLVHSYGGYYENSSVNGTAEYGGRNASYTTRVPADKYQKFMESLGDIGSVTNSNEYVDDITSSYVDVQTRLKTLNTKLDRLIELEKNAETVEDLLKIEDRINDVTYDIENYKAQLRLYDDKIDYCTVTIDLNEVVTYSEVKKDTAWNRFAEAFKSSLTGFVTVIQTLIIALIYMLPYAAVAAVILIIILIITRKRGAIRKKKLEKKNIEQNTDESN